MPSLKDKLNAHIKAANAYSELSKAKRLKVACLLVKDDRVISIGINGMPSGGSNICEEYVQEGPIAEKVTKPEVIHAEMNAIAFAAKIGVSTDGCSLVITHSPCYECSKLLIQAGIKEVYYEKEYRIVDSIKFLKEYNIKVEKIK